MGYVVRRLTPTECERLQGFPDGWTDLGDTPDTPRYKALGNSMAVPCMRWLGERIQEVDDILKVETAKYAEPAGAGKVGTGATLNRCNCGGEAKRHSKRTHHGTRWFVRCEECGKKTHLHRPNGGDIAEWNEMGRGARP